MTIIKREPAVLIGLLISILTVVGQVLSGDLTWAAAVPVIAGLLIRPFVTPASTPTVAPSAPPSTAPPATGTTP